MDIKKRKIEMALVVVICFMTVTIIFLWRAYSQASNKLWFELEGIKLEKMKTAQVEKDLEVEKVMHAVTTAKLECEKTSHACTKEFIAMEKRLDKQTAK